MRALGCLLLVGLIAAPGTSARTPTVQRQVPAAVIYHFDDSEHWATGWLTELTCKYGCWIPPQSLALSTYVNDDGSDSSGHTYRLMDDLSRTTRWRVSAWVNASDATDTTGLQFRVDDVLNFTAGVASEVRSRIEIRTEVYPGDIGPGWQRVELGVMGILERPDQERTLVSVYMVDREDHPDGRWLVGQIEFDPSPELARPDDRP